MKHSPKKPQEDAGKRKKKMLGGEGGNLLTSMLEETPISGTMNISHGNREKRN